MNEVSVMYQSILVAVDGSDNSRKALEVAAQLAQGTASLTILHVPETLTHGATMVWGIGAVDLQTTPEEHDKIGQEVVSKAADAARDMGVTKLDTRVERGEPARTILRQAEKLGVDAIVLGSRGLSDLSGFVFGSVSHKVTHAANCSVITVR
ncbi:universal stress protein [Aidingimonas halophila]|uniref:Nucleotide-binding universal stress protein, UspA family n=1 Tax=Aidingimonas halophila TaxID=574349 RepID=A0A1H3EIM2_9GAMM|nr:universal stress protein [Aidingimonas halophila]GHC31198.1 hypothetical protein GCM10008094_24440 [Aidingimonas halophila]SDX78623.1 Nucleotide-binding universal stress protein, UspA family [Aidingimonas halophila]